MTAPRFQTLSEQKNATALGGRISALEHMTLGELRAAWRRVVKTSPECRLSADLLRRGIGHRLQEVAYGGCARLTVRKLAAASRAPATAALAVSLKTGTTLVREWHGRTYTVRVLEDGLLYASRHYASLTGIAREITQTAWSGPRFFGIAAAGTAKPSRPEVEGA